MRLTYTSRILGFLLILFSFTQLIPIGVAFLYNEILEIRGFAYAFCISILSGILLFFLSNNKKENLKTRDGFIITAFFWTVLALFGSFPFYFAHFNDFSFVDSLFESISGLTTTGATVFIGLDEMPKSILFYRQFLQWLGGMGIIVLAVAVLPLLGIGGMQLYKAETPGPLKDSKLTPRITETAKALWYVYLSMTIACGVLYYYTGMSAFDSICHSFSTLSIGGFSTHDESFAFFSHYSTQWVAMLFMLIAGMNFALHFTAWSKTKLNRIYLGHYLADSEVKLYFLIILSIFIASALVLHLNFDQNVSKTFQEAAFQSISIATTTGFLTTEYSKWPTFVPIMLLTAAFVGACAGSTGGGIKVIRALILFKQGTGEIIKLIHPNAILSIKLGNKPLSTKIAASVWGFFSLYVVVFIVIFMALLNQGNDFITSFSAVGATLNNLGPGLGNVSENYADITLISKLWLCLAMLLGRLEIFTLLVILSPSFWRK
ncbi:MAG: TrkH family potassium uptake protein [SAR86 cluster bacterium]|jgi:trk system potassium uptake protein|nr:TrkH family potassium uptake protein [SAR86 cluster bacterium]